VGSVKAEGKRQVALRLDPDVLDYFRSTGPGWQSRINEVLQGNVSAEVEYPCPQMNTSISTDTDDTRYPAFNGGMARH
jgi:FPC/CPF motif-containing protein YcgG